MQGPDTYATANPKDAARSCFKCMGEIVIRNVNGKE